MKGVKDLVLFFFFIVFILLVGVIPFFLLYLFSDFIAFLMFRVFRYRYRVIEENLRKSDLKLDDLERKQLMKEIYRNLTDVLIEGLKAFTMTTHSVLRRYRVLNPDILEPYYNKGQSVMGVMAHFNNWEWGTLSAARQLQHLIVGLYLPLNNKLIDRFVRWIRARSGTTLASIFETSKTFEKYRDKNAIFILVADQSPSNKKKSYWLNFFGRETAFLHGPERHARFNHLPVFFIEVKRVRRGFYEVEFSLLADHPETLDEGALTALYARRLEDQIRENPQAWLWSHRRWKLSE